MNHNRHTIKDVAENCKVLFKKTGSASIHVEDDVFRPKIITTNSKTSGKKFSGVFLHKPKPRLTRKAKWFKLLFCEREFPGNEQRIGNMLHWMLCKAHENPFDYSFNFNAEVARSIWGRNYAKFVKFLEVEGILKLKRNYCNFGNGKNHSKIYSFTPVGLGLLAAKKPLLVDDKAQLKALSKARANHTKWLKKNSVAINHFLESEERALSKKALVSLSTKVDGRLYSPFANYRRGLKEQYMVWKDDNSPAVHFDMVSAHPSLFVQFLVPDEEKERAAQWFMKQKTMGNKKQINQLFYSKCINWTHFDIAKELKSELPETWNALKELREGRSYPSEVLAQLESKIISGIGELAAKRGIALLRKGDQVTCKAKDQELVKSILVQVTKKFPFLQFTNKYSPEEFTTSPKPMGSRNVVDLFGCMLAKVLEDRGTNVGKPVLPIDRPRALVVNLAHSIEEPVQEERPPPEPIYEKPLGERDYPSGTWIDKNTGMKRSWDELDELLSA